MILSWPQCVALAKQYGADAETQTEIEHMAKLAEEKGWWEDYKGGMPPKFQMFVAMEAEADRILTFEAETVTGLFQTEAYTRTVCLKIPFREEEKILQLVRLRKDRQNGVLSGDHVPVIKFVLTEGALLRQVGGKEAHAEQLRKLLESAKLPNIDIRVLTNESGEYASMEGSFTVLEFDNPEDPDTVYLESRDGCRYVEAADRVRTFRTVLQSMFEQAMPVEEFLHAKGLA
ncbi:MAG: DUF5753 domain-containing protein [Stackebrandtia sp.]